MSDKPTVLVVDDQPGDIDWLFDRIRDRGYEVVLATNKRVAQLCLQSFAAGRETFKVAIVDVMVASMDLFEIDQLDDDFFEQSRDAGIELCRYARQDLAISAVQLPIAALTVRDDDEVRTAMGELGVPLYNRAYDSPSENIDEFLALHLCAVPARPAQS